VSLPGLNVLFGSGQYVREAKRAPGQLYFFDGIPHNVSDNCDLLLLAESQSATDGLRFYGRIPLRLDKVDATRNCQIQPDGPASVLLRTEID
jgi:hypothetical protein